MIDWEEIIWNRVAWHVLKANAVPMLIDEEKAILIDIRMNERRGRNGQKQQNSLITQTGLFFDVLSQHFVIKDIKNKTSVQNILLFKYLDMGSVAAVINPDLTTACTSKQEWKDV